MSKIDIPNYIKTFYNFGADVDGDRLTAEKATIESALKLQEIVKERIPLLKISFEEFKQTYPSESEFQRGKYEELRDLVKESEK